MQRRFLPIILAVIVSLPLLATAAPATPDGVVNINTASAEQLQLLPRVGPTVAERIISFREANGAFKKLEELVAVKGIGESSLERLRPFVATDGKTTLTEKVRLPRAATTKGGSN